MPAAPVGAWPLSTSAQESPWQESGAALLPDSLELKIQDVLAGRERLVDGIARTRAEVQGSRLPVSVVPVPEASPVTAPAGESFMLIGQWHEPLPIRDQVDRPVVSEVWPVDREEELDAVAEAPARRRRLAIRIRKTSPFPSNEIANHDAAFRQLLVEQHPLLPREEMETRARPR